MSRNPYLYLFLMAAVTYAVRVLPLTLLKRRITHPILHSFLYYVPYVTLAVMTFPAMVQATQSPISGFLALAAAACTVSARRASSSSERSWRSLACAARMRRLMV